MDAWDFNEYQVTEDELYLNSDVEFEVLRYIPDWHFKQAYW